VLVTLLLPEEEDLQSFDGRWELLALAAEFRIKKRREREETHRALLPQGIGIAFLQNVAI
jgi:hypothetical protein